MPFSLNLIISSFWFKVRDVTFPFTWTVIGYFRVINWPDFHIVTYQRIGRPERGREGTASWWSSQNTHDIYQLFAILYGCSSWCPQAIKIVTSKITDYKITITNIIILKILKYCENYQNMTQRQEVTKCYWKNGMDRLAQQGGHRASVC